MDAPYEINAAICRNCLFTVESRHRHDFSQCNCGKSAVDGGMDYFRTIGTEHVVRVASRKELDFLKTNDEETRKRWIIDQDTFIGKTNGEVTPEKPEDSLLFEKKSRPTEYDKEEMSIPELIATLMSNITLLTSGVKKLTLMVNSQINKLNDLEHRISALEGREE